MADSAALRFSLSNKNLLGPSGFPRSCDGLRRLFLVEIEIEVGYSLKTRRTFPAMEETVSQPTAVRFIR